MCGIVGFITTETKGGEPARAKFMRQALIIDTIRGDDSTGVFAVGHEPMYDDNSAYWFKQVGPGSEFVESKAYWDSMYDVTTYRAVVGHNRAATVGGVSCDSAHPFQEGPITLVHNGTLTSTHVLPSPMSSLDGVTVDSHAIAHNLAEHDVKEVVENLYGAFALVWHDSRDNSVNVVRNDDRPLHFGMGQDGKTLFFMSEGEMLHLLNARLKLGVKTIYYPEKGQWLRWFEDTPLDRPVVESLELYVPTYPDYRSNYSAGRYTGLYGNECFGSGWGMDKDDPWEDNLYPKAGALTAQENYVLLGGRSRPLPKLLNEAMIAHDIEAGDRLRFTPKTATRNGGTQGNRMVTGKLDEKYNAVIYSVAPHLGITKDWTVRVVGVKIEDNGEPWFVCKFVMAYVDTRYLSVPMVDDGKVPGPDGRMMSKKEWYALTVDGCALCGRIISSLDMYDVDWVGHDPICPHCDEKAYEKYLYDRIADSEGDI